MRLEIIQFIVPLAFLAVWALTALLNRDAQPLPPRPLGGSSPEGYLRGGNVAGRVSPSGPARYLGAADRVPGSLDNKPASRWSTPVSTSTERPGAERRARGEDGVVILDNESRGPLGGSSLATTAARAARAQSSRRGGRSRSNTPVLPAKSVEPSKPRALSGLVNRSLAEGKARPLEIAPLASPLVPIDLPLAQSVSSSVTGLVPRTQPAPAVTSVEIRSRLASADSLREIAVLSEILQPPVSVRRRGRIRSRTA